MKTIKISLALLSFTAIFASCGGKSAKEYAEEYCECMKDTKNKMSDCNSILEEAKDEFGDDKDAAKEFKETLQDCK